MDQQLGNRPVAARASPWGDACAAGPTETNMAKKMKKIAVGENPPAGVTKAPATDIEIMQAAINQLGSNERMLRLAIEIGKGRQQWAEAGGKLTRPFDLRELGYQLAGRRICLSRIGSVMQVVEADTGKPASFCYFHLGTPEGGGGIGYVIARSFDEVVNGSESK